MSTTQEKPMIDPVVTSTPESQNSIISDLSSPQGSMASKYASEPTPMDTDTATPAPKVMEATGDIVSRKLRIIENLKNQAKIPFMEYMVVNGYDSDTAAALTAHQKFKDCEEKVNRAKEALKSFTAMFEETKTPADGSSNHSLRLVVPNDLPTLQLKALNSNWERLLPLCMNPEQFSWCKEALLEKSFSWKQVRPMILDHFDTPYRKFLLMVEVDSMCQGIYESNREYSNRFQKIHREAASVKSVAQLAISSHFGSRLPSSINQIIDLVFASGEDSAFAAKTPHKRARPMNEDERTTRNAGNTSKVLTNNNNKDNAVHINRMTVRTANNDVSDEEDECEINSPLNRMALDSDCNSTVKRIGLTEGNIKCNGKSFNHTFEVMNLTNDHDMSIGIDFMSNLGIGLTGLPCDI
ncbi:hypothetical protein G6F37_012236 [Rhizopus arrhizus]|nr:hypothetical protein G6F38_012611 [Rhizopus arrhizus]KAG1144843.1 hypothetical protein G6F37_012236 [Rhizopus arrhizus]